MDEPEPARPFQPSRSDDEVTTFMASPVRKAAAMPTFDETGETATALQHIRPPAPSEPDEEEESHTQIRHMPRRGRPTSSASQARVKEPAPPPARKEQRVPEISLSKSAAVLIEDESQATGADAPDFTVQLGPSVAPHAPPMAPPAPHAFAPVTSAPLVSRSQPPPGMAPAMGAAMAPPMPMGPGMSGPGSALRSGQVPAMRSGPVPAMRSGPVPAMQPQMPGFQPQAGFGAVPAHFSVPPAGRVDPPGMAISLSRARAAPKPARVWALAFAGLSVVAACAAFGLTRGGSSQATTAAFVDPSVAPGGRGPVAPAPTSAPAAPTMVPVTQPVQPTVAAAQPVQPTPSPADLLTQPAQPVAAAGTPQVAAASAPPSVVAAVAPPVVAATPAPPAPIAHGPSKGSPTVSSKPPPPAPVAKAEPKPVTRPAAPEPKPVAAAAAPKPAPAPKPKQSPADKEMKDAADALARAQLEQSL